MNLKLVGFLLIPLETNSKQGAREKREAFGRNGASEPPSIIARWTWGFCFILRGPVYRLVKNNPNRKNTQFGVVVVVVAARISRNKGNLQEPP